MKSLKFLIGIAGFTTMLTTAQAQSWLTNGLVAYYPFNGNANDAIGTNNGTPVGAVLTADRFGRTNMAYGFNGVDNYISFNSVPLNQIDDWSLVCWINPASLNQYGCTVGMGYDDGTNADGYSLVLAGNSFTAGNELWGGLVWFLG